MTTHGVVAEEDYPYTSGTSGQTGSGKDPAAAIHYKCVAGT